jgi:hypothetical protein
LIDVSDIFTTICVNINLSSALECMYRCPDHHITQNMQGNASQSIYLPTVCHPSASADHRETEMPLHNGICEHCGNTMTPYFNFLSPPPFWYFETPADLSEHVIPSEHVHFPNQTLERVYRLAAIIYSGELHFNARVITAERTIWTYDGQINNGTPVQDHLASLEHPESLQRYGSKTAYLHIYVLVI